MSAWLGDLKDWLGSVCSLEVENELMAHYLLTNLPKIALNYHLHF